MPRAKRKSTGVKVESEAADPILQHHDPSSSSSATTSNLDATASHLAGYYVPAVAPSDVSTSGDEDDEAWMTNDASGEQDATGPTNQHQQHGGAQSDDDDDDEGAGGAASSGAKNKKEATCRWNDCGHIFADMIKFIDHLHNTHVGTTRNKYACEWTGCSRRGKPQTSRFALLSHLRSHTGEKPFTCPRPDCDKSFTRSDALSKHMRVQHDIMPAPARGGRISAAAMAERAAAEKAAAEGRSLPPASGAGAGTRSSTRRSAMAASGSTDATTSLDEELLGLAGDLPSSSHSSSSMSTAAQIAANAEAMPGDKLHWSYEAMFPPEESSEAQQQQQLQQQQAGAQPGSSAGQPQPNTGSSGFTDEELGIERYSSIRRRIPLSWVDGTLEDWNPTVGASAVAVDPASRPEIQFPHDDQEAEAEANLVLERGRKAWVMEMSRRQAEEFKQAGGSGGAFMGKGQTPAKKQADGNAAAGPSTAGAFYDSDSDMSDVSGPTQEPAAATAPASIPADSTTTAEVPNSGRPKRQIRPPAGRHLDETSGAGGDTSVGNASLNSMQVDEDPTAAGVGRARTLEEESVLSSAPSSPTAHAISSFDASATTAPASAAPHHLSRRQAAPARTTGPSSSSSSSGPLLSTLIRAHLIESSKLSLAQAENKRLVTDLESSLHELRDLKWEKKRVLEAVLEMELGADVKAIFEPGAEEQQEEEHATHQEEGMGMGMEMDPNQHEGHHHDMSSYGDSASAVAAAAAALQQQAAHQRAYQPQHHGQAV